MRLRRLNKLQKLKQGVVLIIQLLMSISCQREPNTINLKSSLLHKVFAPALNRSSG
jgi:uncharacterized lipoprotein YajG